MFNILYLSNTGSVVGGCENRLIDLINNLDKSLYTPLVVCPEAGEFSDKLAEADIPVRICHLPGWRKAASYPFRRLFAMRLARLAAVHHTSIIHTSNLWSNYYAWRAGQLLKIPTVSHVRDLLKPERIHKYLFGKFDRIIAISERTKEPLVLGGIPPEKIEVIYDGIDVARFGTKSTGENVLRKDYSLREHLVGFIGRIEPFKRQKEFIHIAARVLRIRQDVSFLIIGEPAENQSGYLREVHKAIEECSAAEHIIFTGYRRDMPEVLRSLDLVVTLSAGGVVMEAMASGLPVIGTDLGSASEVIDDGITGLLLPQGDVRGVSKGILRLLESREVRNRMGKAGRERAERLFDARRNTKMVEAVYGDLMQKPEDRKTRKPESQTKGASGRHGDYLRTDASGIL